MYLVRPLTDKAKNWVDENVQLEGWQWLGDGFGVDHHYVEALVEGMIGDGLEAGADFEVAHC